MMLSIAPDTVEMSKAVEEGERIVEAMVAGMLGDTEALRTATLPPAELTVRRRRCSAATSSIAASS